MNKPAVFLDRDGVLNALVLDEERGVMASPLSADRLTVLRRVPRILRGLSDRGFLILVVTDQPAVAQGRLTPIGVARIQRKLLDDVTAAGGRIDGMFFCPHDADATGPGVKAEYATHCRCRRPAPGMLLHAAQVHRVDLQRSFMVCRDLASVQAGRAAALETILLSTLLSTGSSSVGSAGGSAGRHDPEVDTPLDLRPHHTLSSLVDVIGLIDASLEAMQSR